MLIYIIDNYHDHARRLYLFKIVGVIAFIIWDNVKFWMNIDNKVISTSFINQRM